MKMVLAVLGFLLSVGATVAIFVLLMPKADPGKDAAKRGKLPGWARKIGDVLDFRTLFLEKILRVLYVFATAYCIISGFLGLFDFSKDWLGNAHWGGVAGILTMLLGPILVRLVFESAMLFFILVRNVIEINSKLGKAGVSVPAAQEPVQASKPAPREEPVIHEPLVPERVAERRTARTYGEKPEGDE